LTLRRHEKYVVAYRAISIRAVLQVGLSVHIISLRGVHSRVLINVLAWTTDNIIIIVTSRPPRLSWDSRERAGELCFHGFVIIAVYTTILFTLRFLLFFNCRISWASLNDSRPGEWFSTGCWAKGRSARCTKRWWSRTTST
jgi:hypothetical protein